MVCSRRLPGRAVPRRRRPVGHHLEGPDLRSRPAGSSRRRPRRCRRNSAASATGITGTAGSATPPTRCRRCSRPVSGAKQERGVTGCCAPSRVSRRRCRSCTASTARGGCPRSSCPGWPVTKAAARSAPATPRPVSSSSTSGARPWTPCSWPGRPACPPTEDAWALQVALMNHLESAWREPDNGLWEVRGDRQHFTHSKIMAWVAADRMARSVRTHGLPGPALRWEELREQIHHDVVTHAFDAGRNTFTQAYGSAALDASLLLIPRVGFLPATDPRVLGTIAAVRRELSEGGLVRRYQTSRDRRRRQGQRGPVHRLLVLAGGRAARVRAAAGRHRPVRAPAPAAQRRRPAERGMGPGRPAPAGQHPAGVQPLRPGRQRPPAAHGARGPQRQPDARYDQPGQQR